MDIKEIVRAYLDEIKEELVPMKEELSNDGQEDHCDVLESVLSKINGLEQTMLNAELDEKLSR